jgi:hypothetical protein
MMSSLIPAIANNPPRNYRRDDTRFTYRGKANSMLI